MMLERIALFTVLALVAVLVVWVIIIMVRPKDSKNTKSSNKKTAEHTARDEMLKDIVVAEAFSVGNYGTCYPSSGPAIQAPCVIASTTPSWPCPLNSECVAYPPKDSGYMQAYTCLNSSEAANLNYGKSTSMSPDGRTFFCGPATVDSGGIPRCLQSTISGGVPTCVKCQDGFDLDSAQASTSGACQWTTDKDWWTDKLGSSCDGRNNQCNRNSCDTWSNPCYNECVSGTTRDDITVCHRGQSDPDAGSVPVCTLGQIPLDMERCGVSTSASELYSGSREGLIEGVRSGHAATIIEHDISRTPIPYRYTYATNDPASTSSNSNSLIQSACNNTNLDSDYSQGLDISSSSRGGCSDI